MINVLVLATALVPTTGHTDLIHFARNIPNSQVKVLINGRSFEPVPLNERVTALQEHFKNYSNVEIKGKNNDSAPQNPSDMPTGFWTWWKNEINSVFPVEWDYVVASETYGIKLAEVLKTETKETRFLPYDIQRERNQVTGTQVRKNILTEWKNIIPEFRENKSFVVTMFGQESVGKTTLSKKVSEELNVPWSFEYARPYLETIGPKVDDIAMKHIMLGQASIQKHAKTVSEHPIIIQDTDLYSTVGYYPIMNTEVDPMCVELASELASDLYIVLPDDIPFEPDILRYGDNERESSMQYWIDLLDFYEQKYVVMPHGFSLNEKTKWASNVIVEKVHEKWGPVYNFNRD